jgi:hypothetical protein
MTNRDPEILLPKPEDEALERMYVEGYQREPESPSAGRLGEDMAREVWPDEAWDEASDR